MYVGFARNDSIETSKTLKNRKINIKNEKQAPKRLPGLVSLMVRYLYLPAENFYKWLISRKGFKQNMFDFLRIFDFILFFVEGVSSVRINRKYRLEFIVREVFDEEVVTICRLLEISNHYQ